MAVTSSTTRSTPNHLASMSVSSMDRRRSACSMRMLLPSLLPSGYLLFLRQGTLFAQAFDPVRLELTGNPFRVAEQLAWDSAPALSASATGTLVFRTGSAV